MWPVGKISCSWDLEALYGEIESRLQLNLRSGGVPEALEKLLQSWPIT
jgi:hypothetical protein